MENKKVINVSIPKSGVNVEATKKAIQSLKWEISSLKADVAETGVNGMDKIINEKEKEVSRLESLLRPSTGNEREMGR